eukprot:814369-Prymnesium_polylepis.1
MQLGEAAEGRCVCHAPTRMHSEPMRQRHVIGRAVVRSHGVCEGRGAPAAGCCAVLRAAERAAEAIDERRLDGRRARVHPSHRIAAVNLLESSAEAAAAKGCRAHGVQRIEGRRGAPLCGAQTRRRAIARGAVRRVEVELFARDRIVPKRLVVPDCGHAASARLGASGGRARACGVGVLKLHLLAPRTLRGVVPHRKRDGRLVRYVHVLHLQRIEASSRGSEHRSSGDAAAAAAAQEMQPQPRWESRVETARACSVAATSSTTRSMRWPHRTPASSAELRSQPSRTPALALNRSSSTPSRVL